ncbi:hypothetical protein BZG36_05400 [Bifiguratus adelaidae]|uniref:Uncharacterized protein n=1 Tax=Bifiguratus adelaidae TaxID=1938954 RepID=A0A261XT93_9FUNG|nr:hypothetical protein BZG36_05400 [Bifiguratus adelaidae]
MEDNTAMPSFEKPAQKQDLPSISSLVNFNNLPPPSTAKRMSVSSMLSSTSDYRSRSLPDTPNDPRDLNRGSSLPPNVANNALSGTPLNPSGTPTGLTSSSPHYHHDVKFPQQHSPLMSHPMQATRSSSQPPPTSATEADQGIPSSRNASLGDLRADNIERMGRTPDNDRQQRDSLMNTLSRSMDNIQGSSGMSSTSENYMNRPKLPEPQMQQRDYGYGELHPPHQPYSQASSYPQHSSPYTDPYGAGNVTSPNQSYIGHRPLADSRETSAYPALGAPRSMSVAYLDNRQDSSSYDSQSYGNAPQPYNDVGKRMSSHHSSDYGGDYGTGKAMDVDNQGLKRSSFDAGRSLPPKFSVDNGYGPDHAKHRTQPSPSSVKETPTKRPELIINNDLVKKSVEGLPETWLEFNPWHQGKHLYTPNLLLPNLEAHPNGLLEVRIPAPYLSFGNIKVRRRALWGTDVYTDDSDIVAMLVHTGSFIPPCEDIEGIPTLTPTLPRAVIRHPGEDISSTSMKPDYPDGDLAVTLRVMPRLQKYASTIRNRVKSREWGNNHDGMSLMIEKVTVLKRGEAKKLGRKQIKREMKQYLALKKEVMAGEGLIHAEGKARDKALLSLSFPLLFLTLTTMGVFDEFTSLNFSLYGQWAGVISIVLLIVMGVLTITHNIIFSIVGWVLAFILVFVEVPFLMKCCPTSPKFDTFITRFENAWLRAILYLVFAVVMFLSNLMGAGLEILSAVFLLIAAICYFIAAIRGQPHASSRILGGTGVDNIV